MSDVERIKELEDAIRTHRSQKADDRCIEDDDRLYAVLQDGVTCDRHVGDKAAMLHNCARFIQNRCEAGQWLTYAELEAELKRVKDACRVLANHSVGGLVALKDLDEAYKIGFEGSGR